jgi:predicted acyl esterase
MTELFAYLQDVDPMGNATYVTEGELRVVSQMSDDPPPYKDVTPYHSYKRKDTMPLVSGEVAELVFDLLPTSYLFMKGHSIRVAIAGADKDHFALTKTDPPPTLQFYRDDKYASSIELPVIAR